MRWPTTGENCCSNSVALRSASLLFTACCADRQTGSLQPDPAVLRRRPLPANEMRHFLGLARCVSSEGWAMQSAGWGLTLVRYASYTFSNQPCSAKRRFNNSSYTIEIRDSPGEVLP